LIIEYIITESMKAPVPVMTMTDRAKHLLNSLGGMRYLLLLLIQGLAMAPTRIRKKMPLKGRLMKNNEGRPKTSEAKIRFWEGGGYMTGLAETTNGIVRSVMRNENRSGI
jgi:hypothetical protein